MKKIALYIPLCFFAFFGCEEVLFEEDLSDKEIILIAPSDSTTVANTSLTFSWEPVDQATAYHLQLAQPDFENATQILVDTTVASTSFNTTLTKNTYQWRVRAENSGSATPYVSAGFRIIESEDFSAREVLLTAPQNEAITNSATSNLQWQTVADAALYRVQLLNSANEVVDEQTTTATTISINFPEGVSRWQVRAENNTQSTLYTTRTLTVDTKNPKKPVTTAPANDASQTATSVTFEWTREAVEGTVEFDSIYVYKDEQLTQLALKNRVTSPAAIELEANTTYYWFIKGFDEAGNQSESSDTSKFTIN